jgi:hypothetical protein
VESGYLGATSKTNVSLTRRAAERQDDQICTTLASLPVTYTRTFAVRLVVNYVLTRCTTNPLAVEYPPLSLCVFHFASVKVTPLPATDKSILAKPAEYFASQEQLSVDVARKTGRNHTTHCSLKNMCEFTTIISIVSEDLQ